MSDSNPSNISKGNFTEDQHLKNSEPLISSTACAFKKNAFPKHVKCATVEVSCSNSRDTKDSVSPGAEVCASRMYEDTNCNDCHAHSVDKFALCDTKLCMPTLSGQPSTDCVTDDTDKALFSEIIKSKTSVSANSKYSVENRIVPSNSKNRNSSNFSIFGQLLNKRPNNGLAPRSTASSNSYSLPQSTMQDYQTSPLSRNKIPEASDGLQRAQMKTKLRSMWNNVKYGWKIKREVNLKTDSAIWLLGQCYHNKLNDEQDLSQDVSEQLRLDLLSKILLTYRINFPPIPGTDLVTDSGWGCMLRCGQMMMAQAFVCHFLQRDWRLTSKESEGKNQLYKAILRWFGDSMSDKSPFSLHHLVSFGRNYGRNAGDWYGPTHVAHVLRDALNGSKQHHSLLSELCMYVASDGIVFKQDVMDLCLDTYIEKKNYDSTSISSDFATVSLAEIQGSSSGEILKGLAFSDLMENTRPNQDTNEELKSFEATCPSYSEFGPPSYSTVKPKWKSLILFVSVRLGNDKMNPFYIPCLKSLLAYEHCIGIIGGRPKHALYFIGWQDDKIIHLDPHSCQPAIDVEKEDFSEKTFHSSSVRMMSFKEMDPSCSIGFYFRELKEFQNFIEKFAEITAPLKRNLEYPIFALADGKRIEAEDDVDRSHEECIYPSLNNPQIVDDDIDDDDYILL